MATINVKRVTVKRKDNKPQKKITFRRVVINDQVQKLNNAAASRKAGG